MFLKTVQSLKPEFNIEMPEFPQFAKGNYLIDIASVYMENFASLFCNIQEQV